MNRRDFLKFSAASALALALPSSAAPTTQRNPYTTCFYQFSLEALKALSPILPNRDNALHLFTESSPTPDKRIERYKFLKSAGPSFKYSYCLDAKHYASWQSASHDQLKDLAKRYREKALDPSAPSDYFAFNEMGFFGHRKPEIRTQLARWMRHVHDPHDGGPALQGVFYLTEGNLKPDLWQGNADDFWTALDETCALIVGEHFHSYADVTSQGSEKYAQSLSIFPQWLEQSDKRAQMNIAQNKYTLLHSCFYAPTSTKWGGVRSDQHPRADLDNYFKVIFTATRKSLHGGNRICFGPLNNKDLDPTVYPAIAAAFANDL